MTGHADVTTLILRYTLVVKGNGVYVDLAS